jgi:minor extracellular serine protease Vpr
MRARTTRGRAFGIVTAVTAVSGLILTTGLSAQAQPGSHNPVPVRQGLRSAELNKTGSLAPALRGATGTVTVSVAMSEEPLATAVGEGAIAEKTLPSRTWQRARTAAVTAQQDRVVREARDLGARALGRATKAANVVAMRLPAKNLERLTKLRGVVSVKPVARYEMHADPGGSGSLAQAADYLKVNPVRAAGYDGTGIRVGILDSGIDYTHAYLGGPGTTAAYQQCYSGASGTAYNETPTGICATHFGPSAPKVKGGYDFVGENWPGSATAPVDEQPDPNPIDFDGHGTHVSDIAGGRSADGSHKGIAPGVDLYAIKVCSAVSTFCSSIAILQGIDWALDPNNNGDISDAMDVVNLSLGSAYGQVQDDTGLALNNLVRAGVVAVASAGNSADRPFIVSSPSTAPRVISVAQTALPDDKLYSIRVDSPTIAGLPNNTIRYAKLQAWSPAPTRVISAVLAQPTGTHEGCTAATFNGFPAGAVALIKRGTCNASLKAQLAQAAGASAAIIWNNVPGDPPDFSFGTGPEVTIPTFTISYDKGLLLSNAVTAGPVRVTIDPTATISIRNTVVGTSSRGPSISGIRAKPDIGAPGAWLSAEVGTGDGQTNFSGTSGAAPVVTGAAALLLDRYPNASPATIKARLLNGASTANRTPDANADLYATPISRIGAGEVRAAPAFRASGVLSARLAGGGNIGLGLPHLDQTRTYPVTLQLKNTASSRRTYVISPQFRNAADRRSGAVTVKAPAVVRVAAKSTAEFTVRFTINPRKLAQWPFTHAAGYTGSGAELNGPEFDGYLKAISVSETLHLGWTVLPHRSADVSAAAPVRLTGGHGPLTLTNTSTVLDGAVHVFGLTGTSGRFPKPAPGQPGSAGSNIAVIDLAAAGVRDDVTNGLISFAVAGQRRQTIPLYPAGYEIDIDTNRDGTFDYAVFQQEAVGRGLSGESLVYVLNVATGAATAYFYTDADFDVRTQVLSVPLSSLGLRRGSTFDFRVRAFDNYFTGLVTDTIENQAWTVGAAKYELSGGADSLAVPAGRTIRVSVAQTSAAESTQTGLLLFYDDAVRRDAQAVTVTGGSSAAVVTTSRSGR